jgi:quercetin dioxygenase-like cupin family protein
MDVVNIGRSKRFLRERPVRVTLFDRPRLVCDLICLEAGQTEKRRGLDTSDSLYVVIEGNARLRFGPQLEDLEPEDTALVPPGVDHTIQNTGEGRASILALVTPKPTRAGEVRMPVERRPREAARAPQRDFRAPRPAREPSRGRGRDEGEGPAWFPRPRPQRRFQGASGGRPQERPRGRAVDERETLPDETQRGGRRPQTGRRPAGGGRPGAAGRGPSAPGRGERPQPRGRGGPRETGPGRQQARGRGSAQSGRRAPGRSGPRTSGRRQSPE